MRKFEYEALHAGPPVDDYPGAFAKPVREVIKSLISGDVLHLYSGASFIGNERIDTEHPNATINCPVEDFIVSDRRDWDWVILDPPYEIKHKDKLRAYADNKSVSGNILIRQALIKYFRLHTNNVLWLDQCPPIFTGFKRVKLWFFMNGAWDTIRVLSWLKREMNLLL